MYVKQELRSITNTMYLVACISAAIGILLPIAIAIMLICGVEIGYVERIIACSIFFACVILAVILFARLYLNEDKIHEKWFDRVARRKDLYTMAAKIVERQAEVDDSLESDTGDIVVRHAVKVRIANSRLHETVDFYGHEAYQASLKLPTNEPLRIDVVEWVDQMNRPIARSFALRTPMAS